MLEKISKTADFIRSKTKLRPQIAIVLGTGLGGLVNEIEIIDSISYNEIPNFPVSTVKGHQGRLIFGKLSGKDVVAMQGRFHFYEGYTMQEVTFPFRVFKNLGIETLFLSNAAGGMNENFKVGDIMFINDHINLMGTNPLIGHNYDELGPRFPDFSEPYDNKLLETALSAANDLNIPVHHKHSCTSGCICGHEWSDLRNTGRIPLCTHHRRRCCWYVYCSRSHCCPSFINESLCCFSHHRFGRHGRSGGCQPRRSD